MSVSSTRHLPVFGSSVLDRFVYRVTTALSKEIMETSTSSSTVVSCGALCLKYLVTVFGSVQ